ncbi:plasmid mobilization relaxosome protein MobC [Bosea sp. (in: a-proteobacteria)]|uniref:plasmid mobilization protein n=1 Tax=Bosea sp. (in: a-proteobacteria) TaxID=1871050 RepID=UPI0027326BC1|nr:plasmid mobilization relaxosome protein MobC [Bosea sp. (in: a-proteobacteria)]MDP3409803.1 plasmid mobilization relaxosome protein MobC [Bosea sp. (in: a-proteobacteria)]
MPTLTLRVSDELALQFAALAATEGGKSALIRRLLEGAVGAPESKRAPVAVGSPQKVTVRFRESELRQLGEMATARGMTRTQWITSLVRSRLGAPAQQSDGEREALRAIARELNRIGGNINQIARAANGGEGGSAGGSKSGLDDARVALEALQGELKDVLERTSTYWEGR